MCHGYFPRNLARLGDIKLWYSPCFLHFTSVTRENPTAKNLVTWESVILLLRALSKLDLVDFLINLYEAYSLHSGKNEITLMFLSLKEEVIYLECTKRIWSLALHKICTEKKELRYGENK